MANRVPGSGSIRWSQGSQDKEREAAPFPIEIIATALAENEEKALSKLGPLDIAVLDSADDRQWTLLNYALFYRFPRLALALIKRGADCDHLTSRGMSVLTFAAGHGYLEVAEAILARGADIDAAEEGNYTALLFATQERQRPMVELLLAHHAKTEPPRPYQPRAHWRNALMIAAKTGDIQLAERILKAGGDINAADSSGENIVFYAVRSGSLAMLEWVLAQGGYPHLVNDKGDNALALAAEGKSFDILKALIARGVIKHTDLQWHVARSNSFEMQEYVRNLEKNANLDSPTLFWNQSEITTEQVREYIKRGGDVNYAENCPTPLQEMTQRGDVDAVKLLLENGARPELRGRVANSTVFFAVGQRTDDLSLQLLRLFLEYGVSPNTKEYIFGMEHPEKIASGETLLMSAIRLGHIQCASLLLERGADPLLASEFSGTNAFDELAKTRFLLEKERDELRIYMKERAKALGHAPEEPPRNPKARDEADTRI